MTAVQVSHPTVTVISKAGSLELSAILFDCSIQTTGGFMLTNNKFYNSFKELSDVYSLAALGMLLSLRIVLGIFANYTMAMFGNTVKISFNFLPIIVAAIMFGPVGAGIVGAAGDFLSFFINPAGGTYFPGFTLNGLLTGIIFGLFLYKNKDKVLNIILAWAVNTVFVEVLLSGYWLYFMYGAGSGNSFGVYLGIRAISELLIKSVPTILLMITFCKISVKIKIPQKKKH